LNKNQKIILTIWIVLIALLFIATLSPINQTSMGIVTKSWLEPSWGQFIVGGIIVSIPSFIIYKIWGK